MSHPKYLFLNATNLDDAKIEATSKGANSDTISIFFLSNEKKFMFIKGSTNPNFLENISEYINKYDESKLRPTNYTISEEFTNIIQLLKDKPNYIVSLQFGQSRTHLENKIVLIELELVFVFNYKYQLYCLYKYNIGDKIRFIIATHDEIVPYGHIFSKNMEEKKISSELKTLFDQEELKTENQIETAPQEVKASIETYREKIKNANTKGYNKEQSVTDANNAKAALQVAIAESEKTPEEKASDKAAADKAAAETAAAYKAAADKAAADKAAADKAVEDKEAADKEAAAAAAERALAAATAEKALAKEKCEKFFVEGKTGIINSFFKEKTMIDYVYNKLTKFLESLINYGHSSWSDTDDKRLQKLLGLTKNKKGDYDNNKDDNFEYFTCLRFDLSKLKKIIELIYDGPYVPHIPVIVREKLTSISDYLLKLNKHSKYMTYMNGSEINKKSETNFKEKYILYGKSDVYSPNSDIFYEKYLKYKRKYLNLKKNLN
jgi:hypothetical protein